jgi:preprotein translocase subunit SecF
MINIIKKRFLFFAISITALFICIVFLIASGLNIGMDFSGGSRLTISFEQQVKLEDLETELSSIGYGTAIVQSTSGNDFIIRTSKLTADEKETIKESLTATFGELTEKGFEDITPETALGTARIAIIGLVLAAIGIMIYITWAFRAMPKPFRYGVCAVVALIHDTLIVLGIFSILGIALSMEVNLMFITGILAVIGYSVNIITVLALILFIGTNINSFAWALFIGILAGTFDSLFIAPSLLVVWEKNEWRRFIDWLPFFKKKTIEY